MIKMLRQTRGPFCFADQLRRLAMNVKGMSFAGGKAAGALLSGTDSGIVLRVVTSRARV